MLTSTEFEIQVLLLKSTCFVSLDCIQHAHYVKVPRVLDKVI